MDLLGRAGECETQAAKIIDIHGHVAAGKMEFIRMPGTLSVSRKKSQRKRHFDWVRLAKMKSIKIREATFFAGLASKKPVPIVRERVLLV